MNQIAFYDVENDSILGGLQFDNGDVICGCCGGLIEKSDFDDGLFTILKVFDSWIDLTETIIGDEIFE